MASAPAQTSQQDGNDSSSDFDAYFDAVASGGEPPAEAAGEAADPTGTETSDDAPPPEGAGQDQDAAPTPGPADTASDDVDWGALPPAAKAAYDRAQQQVQSLKGRQSSLDRQLHAFRSQTAQPPRDGDQGQGTQPAAPAIDAEKLKALREDYPEIAGPLLDVIEDLQGKVTSQGATVARVQEADTEAFYAAQVGSLTELMPDWQTWGQDPRIDDWLATQPRHIREAAARNSEFIVDASEAHDVIARFKAAHPSAAAPTPDPKRQRQMDAGRDAATKQPAAATGVPDDFDAAFDAGAKARERGGTRR